MSDSITFKVAQVTGVLVSALTAGGGIGLSILTIPVMILPARRLRQAPTAEAETCAAYMSQLKQQWVWLYSRGRATFPPLAATAALAYSYLAYVLSDNKLARWWYITAAASTISIVPFTLLVMMPTNNLLGGLATHAKPMKRESQKGGATDVPNEEEKEKVKKQGEEQDEEFLRLMTKWTRLNSLRALLPLTGAVIGLTAALRW